MTMKSENFGVSREITLAKKLIPLCTLPYVIHANFLREIAQKIFTKLIQFFFSMYHDRQDIDEELQKTGSCGAPCSPAS